MVHMDSTEAAERAIGLLAQRGEILSPLKPHPKPDDGGCGSLVRDRFGYIWIITCPNEEKDNPLKAKKRHSHAEILPELCLLIWEGIYCTGRMRMRGVSSSPWPLGLSAIAS